MEKENISLLAYFDKFKAYPDFDKMKEKLAKQSQFRYHHDITLGEVTIPFIGPDFKLSNFSKEIGKKWGSKEGAELAYVLKYYEGGEIENIGEALIITEIKYQESQNDNFLAIKAALIEGKKPPDNLLQPLLLETDGLTSSLLFFLLKMD